ncbi:MFS transporter-like protein, partial [Tricladium varicosporioides]
KALVWKQDLRIIPLSATVYMLCYLDRANIGNAKTLNSSTHHSLLDDNHMTNYQYVVALMVFLISYAIFEVPSNYYLKRFRPSRWVAFLAFSCGATTIGFGATKNFGGVAAVRWILGIFEAGKEGMFPGLIYHQTFWYRVDERSFRVAILLASATISGAFGGAIAYGIGHMSGHNGLSGWRWLFILEGIPPCLGAVLIWFFLPDYPETANWLTAEEKTLAKRRLAAEGSKGDGENMTWIQIKETLMDWRLYAHYALYFGIAVPFSSLSLFTPSITLGLGYHDLMAQAMTVPPYAISYIVTLFVSWSADHFNARALHCAVFALIGAAGFLASALLPTHAYLPRYGALIIAAAGGFSCIPPLIGFLSSNLFSTAAAGLAIAINVSVGAPGQIAGVWIYKPEEAAKGYPTGHWTNAGLLLFVCAGAVAMRLYYGLLNRRLMRKGLGEGKRLFRY